MGVINLGLLVDKIAKKLEGAGFIKSTDYASASAAGVVKVGTGLSISDAGVLSAAGGGGGFTFDTLYEEPEQNGPGQSTTITLSKSSDDYKILVVVIRSESAYATHIFCPHPQNVSMATAGSAPADSAAYNWKYKANGTSLQNIAGNSSNIWYRVYGIK